MDRRDFLSGTAAATIALPNIPQANASVIEQYDSNVVTVFNNNLAQYWTEQGGCEDCSAKKVERLAKMFSPDFIKSVFDKAQSDVDFTIEAMSQPSWIIKRRNREVLVTSITRRLTANWTANWTPSVTYVDLRNSNETVEYGNKDPEVEITKSLIEQISFDISQEMEQERKWLDPEDVLVFCPYVMPIMTPIIYSADDFTPRRGVMMRYALAVFPKKGKPMTNGHWNGDQDNAKT